MSFGPQPRVALLCSHTGNINSDLLVELLQHFQKHVQASKANPALLILDNHSSHLSLNSVLYCREHSIHVLSTHLHSSQKIQPVDRHFQIAELLGITYNGCITINKSINAFKVCGNVPLDRNIFMEEDFCHHL
ncbi:hypothetical protein PR048_013094 [Dryococelus australis]|uniref:DDE-1 domain-containing protein n=1 Tax=Dryococelus australis TaxID=614101 RepID=A0ABQ9HRN1_9NEOP|nr:hypothetical protein PR048_013094 [Dryococelus australis]